MENNTLGLAGYDMEYYTSGVNKTFIKTDIGIVDISDDSYVEILQFIDIEMLTVNGPAVDVELEILQGDLLFTNDTKSASIGGEKMITFTPNTITYAVQANSNIGRKIARAKKLPAKKIYDEVQALIHNKWLV